MYYIRLNFTTKNKQINFTYYKDSNQKINIETKRNKIIFDNKYLIIENKTLRYLIYNYIINNIDKLIDNYHILIIYHFKQLLDWINNINYEDEFLSYKLLGIKFSEKSNIIKIENEKIKRIKEKHYMELFRYNNSILKFNDLIEIFLNK